MRILGLLLAASVLLAQDAGMVIQTSVGLGARRNTVQPTGELARKVDQLTLDARAAFAKGEFGEALRGMHHALALLNGQEWSAALELAASLEARLDHSIIEPGGEVAVTWHPLYPANGGKLAASLALRPGGGGESRVLLADQEVEAGKLPVTWKVKLPEDAAGPWFIDARLGGPNAKAPYLKTRPVTIAKLTSEVEALRERLAKSGKDGSALATAHYAGELIRRADAGLSNPHAYDLAKEIRQAHEILDAVAAGQDPFVGRTDTRRAYAAADGSLQPYRLFVPAAYDGKSAKPLVVALHGMGGNENSMFDGYGGAVRRQAERLGWLLVAPKGLEPTSMYRGAAEKDVLDVIAEVRRAYKVDADRIYVMGHSMGGFGSWSIAMNHPDLFAALGPVAGGGAPGSMDKIKHVPQFVVHGDADKTVLVTQSRAMVEAARRLGAVVEYVEVKGGNHVDIVVPNLAAMFDFFAKQARGR